MGWLSTPGFFTRWMAERALKHKVEKENQEMKIRHHRMALDQHRLRELSTDNRFATKIRIENGGRVLEGLVLGCSAKPYEVSFLTPGGEVCVVLLQHQEKYEMLWDGKLDDISQAPIDEDDLDEYKELCADILSRRPDLVGMLFTAGPNNELVEMPWFVRNYEFVHHVRMDTKGLFLLGWNAQALLTFAELKDLSSKIRREEMAYLERWFNNGHSLRKPIVPGVYIKVGNELVVAEDRETEWLVVETYDPPLIRDQHLVDMLAYNLEDKCFQTLLSYNFHITGCVTSPDDMFVGGV